MSKIEACNKDELSKNMDIAKQPENGKDTKLNGYAVVKDYDGNVHLETQKNGKKVIIRFNGDTTANERKAEIADMLKKNCIDRIIRSCNFGTEALQSTPQSGLELKSDTKEKRL